MSPTTVTQVLTGPQFAAITDFTDLHLEFSANMPVAAVTNPGVGASAGLGVCGFLGTGLVSVVWAASGVGAAAAVSPATYVGAGDALSGWYLWSGLRAYTAAGIGANAITLRRDGDNATADFVTVSGGGLDTASIATFLAGGSPPSSTLYCTKLFDQTGNGRHPAQTTAANQPVYSSTSGPGGKPGLAFDLSKYMQVGSLSQAVTLSMSFVCQTNPDGTHDFGLGGNSPGAGGILLQRGVSVSLPNTLELYDGNAFARATNATDNTWLAVNALVQSGGGGYIEVNGTQFNSTVNFGADTAMTTFYIGFDGSRLWRGIICEAGVAPGGTTTTIDTVNSNQRSYWGF